MPTDLDAVLLEGETLAPAATADPLAQVVVRILAGDLDAFENLMALTEAKVLGLAWRLLGDRDQARDAAQEVFLRVFRSLERFRQEENLQAWMYRITVNVCCDHARKRGPVMASAEILDSPSHAHPGQDHAQASVLLAERRALVRRALGALTPAERSALVLRDLEGFTTEAVAQTLGVRPVTIRSQISSARAKVQAFCAQALAQSPGGRP